MTRPRALTALGLAVLLGLLGMWLLNGPAPVPAPVTVARPADGPTAETLDRLLGEMQLIALAGEPAPAFTLETLDGAPLAMGDLAGRPALLYFWASW
jgi:hypothetical protein